MKKLLFTAWFALLALEPVYGQTAADSTQTMIRVKDLLDDTQPALPRQRVSRITSFALTDQWQTVPFSPGSSFDQNTFPETRFNYTNNTIRTNPAVTTAQGYNLTLNMIVTSPTQNAVKIQIRYVIPTVNFVFPFPDMPEANRYFDVATIIAGNTQNILFPFNVYTDTNFRQYGCQIQIRALAYQQSSNLISGLLSSILTTLTGTNRATITNATLNIYAL